MMLLAAVSPYVETHSIGVVFYAVLVASGVVEVAGAARQRPEATSKDRGSRLVLRLCLVPGAVFLALSSRIAPGAEIQPPLAGVLAGTALVAAGELMRVWAKATLGRYFTYTVMTSGDQPVITGGPYRWLRHPSYTGVLLIAAGVGAAIGNWLGLGVLFVMAFVGVGYRVHVEERALLEEMGDRYREFAASRKRVVPFVW
jgi:protein-S-isoprenylcysteine O-methyltransferase Ste14